MRMRPLVHTLTAFTLFACRATREERLVEVAAPPDVEQSHEAFSCPMALLETRRGGAEPGAYQEPSNAECTAFEQVFHELSASPTHWAALATKAAAAGFEIRDLPENAGILLAREGTVRRGRGAYLIRTGAHADVIIQAPHTFFDQGTLPLACELFDRTHAAALFINTAHRYKAAEARGNLHPADVAHAPQSLFLAATTGILRSMPKATVVQVHGFAPRESKASVVVSSGERAPDDPLVEQTAVMLSSVVGPGVLRFPRDTSELGATTNVEAAAVRAAGGRFLHVEISEPLRATLLRDGALRARFLDALAGSLRLP